MFLIFEFDSPSSHFALTGSSPKTEHQAEEVTEAITRTGTGIHTGFPTYPKVLLMAVFSLLCCWFLFSFLSCEKTVQETLLLCLLWSVSTVCFTKDKRGALELKSKYLGPLYWLFATTTELNIQGPEHVVCPGPQDEMFLWFSRIKNHKSRRA